MLSFDGWYAPGGGLFIKQFKNLFFASPPPIRHSHRRCKSAGFCFRYTQSESGPRALETTQPKSPLSMCARKFPRSTCWARLLFLLDDLCWLLYQRYSNPRSSATFYDNFANKESERLPLLHRSSKAATGDVAGFVSMTCSVVYTLEGRKKMFVAINRYFFMRKSYARKSLKQIIPDFFIRRVEQRSWELQDVRAREREEINLHNSFILF